MQNIEFGSVLSDRYPDPAEKANIEANIAPLQFTCALWVVLYVNAPPPPPSTRDSLIRGMRTAPAADMESNLSISMIISSW